MNSAPVSRSRYRVAVVPGWSGCARSGGEHDRRHYVRDYLGLGADCGSVV